MFINSVIIRNFRNFRDFEVVLKPFTLIIGENNIGKTNFLNALGLIFSQEVTFFKKRFLEIEDINYYAIYEFKKEIIDTSVKIEDVKIPKVIVEVRITDFDRKQQAVVGDWLINEELNEAKLTYIFQPKEDLAKWIQEQREKALALQKYDGEDSELYEKRKFNVIDFPIKKYAYNLYGGLDQNKQVDNYFLKMLKFEFLEAVRDVKNQLIASNDFRLLYRILSSRGDNRYEDIKEVLSLLADKINENSELKIVIKDIEDYLKKTSLVGDDKYNKVQFEFTKVEENEILKKLSLVYGDSPVNVERNGTGRNNLLYISLLLSHLISRNQPEICFRVIGIEEPESHLHPHLQEHLAKNIAGEVKKDLQLIITSLSTHITSQLDLGKTLIFYRENDDIKTHYVLSNFEDANGIISAKNEHHIRYLCRYLDATKSTMFFARKIILVEGISEQILIPKFYEILYNRTLEKIGATIVGVNGVAFNHFLEIIKNGYFIKCLVITDKDKEKMEEENETEDGARATSLIEKYENACPDLIKVVISKEYTFEKDIIEANKNANGKKILSEALKLTRPNKGKTFIESLGENDILIDPFFALIDEFKAEFATNLFTVLKDDYSGYNIPLYIKEGLDFINT